ncbi:MAG TPA: hypothetical protein VK358_04995, partial [Longimicrobium sp.]|nr:hypothetical protein [Longimicrobium sp.]
VISTLALAVTAILATADLSAQAASLTFSPARPQAGEPVRVEYRATGRLAAQRTLVLRARYRSADAGAGAELAVLGRLHRASDGAYRGTVSLPKGAVYSVLAVEDTAATAVDAGGELWEVRLHDAGGRPTFHALKQHYNDVAMRNRQLSQAAAEQLVALYPAHPHSHFIHLIRHRDGASAAMRDSLEAAHRATLAALLPRVDTLNEEMVTSVVFYAGSVQDTLTQRVWRERLFRLFPSSRNAKQQRVFLVSAKNGRPAAWEELERLWRADQTLQEQLTFTALQNAQAWKDPEQIRRWGQRGLDHGTVERSMLISAYMAHPELKAEGMAHIRAYVRELERRSDDARPITQTRPEFAATLRRWSAGYLAQLGQALAEAGQQRAALDTLSIAVESMWDPARFRTVAKLRLEMGDTAGALPLLARVAADPNTSPSFADSVAAQFGRHVNGAQWALWVERGVAAMTEHVMLYAVDRAAAGGFRLTDEAGASHTFQGAHHGETFVAVFSSH